MRTVLFAILPELVLLDVAGAADAFRIAEREAPGNYQLRFVSTQPTVRSAVGLHLDKLELLPEHIPDHSVIVVTGVTSKGLRLDSAPAMTLARWLKHDGGARCRFWRRVRSWSYWAPATPALFLNVPALPLQS